MSGSRLKHDHTDRPEIDVQAIVLPFENLGRYVERHAKLLIDELLLRLQLNRHVKVAQLHLAIILSDQNRGQIHLPMHGKLLLIELTRHTQLPKQPLHCAFVEASAALQRFFQVEFGFVCEYKINVLMVFKDGVAALDVLVDGCEAAVDLFSDMTEIFSELLRYQPNHHRPHLFPMWRILATIRVPEEVAALSPPIHKHHRLLIYLIFHIN